MESNLFPKFSHDCIWDVFTVTGFGVLTTPWPDGYFLCLNSIFHLVPLSGYILSLSAIVSRFPDENACALNCYQSIYAPLILVWSIHQNNLPTEGFYKNHHSNLSTICWLDAGLKNFPLINQLNNAKTTTLCRRDAQNIHGICLASRPYRRKYGLAFLDRRWVKTGVYNLLLLPAALLLFIWRTSAN